MMKNVSSATIINNAVKASNLYHFHDQRWESILKEARHLWEKDGCSLPVIFFSCKDGEYNITTLSKGFYSTVLLCWGKCPKDWNIIFKRLWDERDGEQFNALKKDFMRTLEIEASLGF